MQQMNMQQRKAFQDEMEKELDQKTMRWTKVLKEWHPHALNALKTSSPVSLNIPTERYPQLIQREVKEGLNMNIVAILANNLERKTPREMGMTIEEYAVVLSLNTSVCREWEAIVAPLREVVQKRIELISVSGNILSPVTAEA